MTPEDAPIGYERSLLRGHKPQVVTVEIRVASKGDAHAERTILALLEWAKEGYPTDFNLDTWQVTGIADDFSVEAKAYNPDWQDDDDPNEGIDGPWPEGGPGGDQYDHQRGATGGWRS